MKVANIVPGVVSDLFSEAEKGDTDRFVYAVRSALEGVEKLNLASRVDLINRLRAVIHEYSPFNKEPVDVVQWVPANLVTANDYNPNAVAPPEMELLAHSIEQDGYTQPIVAWKRDDGIYEVVDGFHRHRVGREHERVMMRIAGYLPLVVINDDRQERGDRIAATIRHNRARGKHRIDGMSDIVLELKRRNWPDQKIQKELGMDPDEVLRLTQITGLADLFSDRDFSKAWEVEGHISEDDFVGITDDAEYFGDEVDGFRVVNVDDPDRIFHTYDKWECYAAGLYATHVDGLSRREGEEMYRKFLSDIPRFEKALEGVTTEWKHSCEHYLTNKALNRIAWLGQASACYDMGIPSIFRSGFNLLTEEQQELADQSAHKYLNKWLKANGRDAVDIDSARTTRQSVLY